LIHDHDSVFKEQIAGQFESLALARRLELLDGVQCLIGGLTDDSACCRWIGPSLEMIATDDAPCAPRAKVNDQKGIFGGQVLEHAPAKLLCLAIVESTAKY
jgi:hypothetical protein